MFKAIALSLLFAAPVYATEFTFSVPMKSGPLLGTVAVGSIDLEDGVFTGTGTEVFTIPNNFIPSTGDILAFEITALTLTFTDAESIGGPSDLRIVFEDGVVTQFSYLGALTNPGASAFLTIDSSKNQADLRTTGGEGQQLRSLGGPFTFVQIN